MGLPISLFAVIDYLSAVCESVFKSSSPPIVTGLHLDRNWYILFTGAQHW